MTELQTFLDGFIQAIDSDKITIDLKSTEAVTIAFQKKITDYEFQRYICLLALENKPTGIYINDLIGVLADDYNKMVEDCNGICRLNIVPELMLDVVSENNAIYAVFSNPVEAYTFLKKMMHR